MVDLHFPVVFLYHFTPIWAFIIWRYGPARLGRKTLFGFSIIVLYVTCFWAFWAPYLPKVSYWLMYYGLFLLINLLVFGVKFRFQFCRTLAVSLWCLFIMGSFWELPIILYDVLGFLFLPFLKRFSSWVGTYTLTQWVLSHINRAYVLASLILFVRLASLKRTRFNMFLIGSGLILNMAVLFMRTGSNWLYVETVAHIIGYGFFTLAVLDGLQ